MSDVALLSGQTAKHCVLFGQGNVDTRGCDASYVCTLHVVFIEMPFVPSETYDNGKKKDRRFFSNTTCSVFKSSISEYIFPLLHALRYNILEILCSFLKESV